MELGRDAPVAERLAAIATLLSRKMFNARRESCEQIFYGEFDGRHRKRVLVKIIGEYANRQDSPDSKGFNRRQRSKRKFQLSLHSLCFLLLDRIFFQLRKGAWLQRSFTLSPVTPASA